MYPFLCTSKFIVIIDIYVAYIIAQDSTLELRRYRMGRAFVAYITRAVLFLSRPVSIPWVLIATTSDVDLTNAAYVSLVEYLRSTHLIKVAPMPTATTEFLLH